MLRRDHCLRSLSWQWRAIYKFVRNYLSSCNRDTNSGIGIQSICIYILQLLVPSAKKRCVLAGSKFHPNPPVCLTLNCTLPLFTLFTHIHISRRLIHMFMHWDALYMGHLLLQDMFTASERHFTDNMRQSPTNAHHIDYCHAHRLSSLSQVFLADLEAWRLLKIKALYWYLRFHEEL